MNDVLGLKRGTVVLKRHDKAWKEAFEVEKNQLKELLGDKVIDIQHIGSTAIPELSAKPLIDMLMAVHNLETDVTAIRPLLESIGYTYREKGPNDDTRRLFMKGSEENRTHHLHVTEADSLFWQSVLNFRDWLLSHPEDVQRYEQLKVQLAEEFADSREYYTQGKSDFVEEILKKALPRS